MSQKYDKLKTLLLELFQLDQPDLDFGLYRIMHARSAEVCQFLDQDLLPQVRDAFAQYNTVDKAEREKELAEVIAGVAFAGMDPDDSPKVKELRARIESDAVDIGTLESEVYDHLFNFFRRYYSEGDFLAKRVYKPGVYAIPYEGEEVTLHWATKDQYYIKTTDYLRDYAFRLRPGDERNPMRVHFRLLDAAEGEHGTAKAVEGKTRVFILAPRHPNSQNFMAEESGDHGPELVIRFEYRPATLTDWPPDDRAGKRRPPTQKQITAYASKRITAATDTTSATWITEFTKPHVLASGEKANYNRLEAHLQRYTARNTFDYFIHRDIGHFLRRELDFYIKNEIMYLDDIENETAPRVEQYLSKIRAVRTIAGKVIDFLAQLEGFQKRLWLKKKFVVKVQYCITVGNIPEVFYPEVVANKDQITEWVQELAIDQIRGDLTTPGYSDDLTPVFLRAHPTLVVDTRHFDADFTARILQAMDNLDDQTDGVVFHSENFQALSLMQTRYQSSVDCVYIDPPYNAASSEIVYKNDYKDSSWLTLMQNRLDISRSLLSDRAAYAIAIDDYEMVHLCEIVDSMFTQCDRHMVVVNHHPQGGMSHNLTRTHEYMLMLTPHGEDILRGGRKSSKIEYRSLVLSGPGRNKSRAGRPNSFFAVLVDEKSKGVVGFEPPPPLDTTYPTEPTEEGFQRVYPVSPSGSEKVWCRSFESAVECLGRGEIVLTKNGKLKLAVDTTGKRHSLMSNWTDRKYNAGPHGTALVADILGDREAFSYPKSLYTVRDAVEAMTWKIEDPLVLDFFAGSATTGHAVIALNREDGARRKFIHVEIGNYFDTVLLPRIKRVTFAPEWKAGRPGRPANPKEAQRSPRIVKVVRLESYEDALNNLVTRRTERQQLVLDTPEAQGGGGFRERYLLGYMLGAESAGSQSLLNVSAFSDPTKYSLWVKQPGSDESHAVNVDLLETFNWLTGLTVRHIAVPQAFSAAVERDSEGRLRVRGRLKQETGGRFWFRTVTGTTPDNRRALVIWRKLTGEPEEDNLVLNEWFTKQGYSARDSEFDLIYVNGGNNLENLKTPDDLWKVRLIEEDFHRLMFDTEGM